MRRPARRNPAHSHLPARILVGWEYDYPAGLLTPVTPFAWNWSDVDPKSREAQEWARTMKFDEPVDVTVWQTGEVTFQDGHHRARAGKILDIDIPVVVTRNRIPAKTWEQYMGFIRAGYAPWEVNPGSVSLVDLPSALPPNSRVIEAARAQGLLDTPKDGRATQFYIESHTDDEPRQNPRRKPDPYAYLDDLLTDKDIKSVFWTLHDQWETDMLETDIVRGMMRDEMGMMATEVFDYRDYSTPPSLREASDGLNWDERQALTHKLTAKLMQFWDAEFPRRPAPRRRRSEPRTNPRSTQYPYLSLSKVLQYEPTAEALGVSEVARGPRGFLKAYREAGGKDANLDPYWQNRREGFISRHLAQVVYRNEPLWDEDGDPTRRHLALIMWAFSPERI